MKNCNKKMKLYNKKMKLLQQKDEALQQKDEAFEVLKSKNDLLQIIATSTNNSFLEQAMRIGKLCELTSFDDFRSKK
jgi:hypothetical protein